MPHLRLCRANPEHVRGRGCIHAGEVPWHRSNICGWVVKHRHVRQQVMNELFCTRDSSGLSAAALYKHSSSEREALLLSGRPSRCLANVTRRVGAPMCEPVVDRFGYSKAIPGNRLWWGAPLRGPRWRRIGRRVHKLGTLPCSASNAPRRATVEAIRSSVRRLQLCMEAAVPFGASPLSLSCAPSPHVQGDERGSALLRDRGAGHCMQYVAASGNLPRTWREPAVARAVGGGAIQALLVRYW